MSTINGIFLFSLTLQRGLSGTLIHVDLLGVGAGGPGDGAGGVVLEVWCWRCGAEGVVLEVWYLLWVVVRIFLQGPSEQCCLLMFTVTEGSRYHLHHVWDLGLDMMFPVADS